MASFQPEIANISLHNQKLAKALGIEGMSASQVSEINKGLDEQVEQSQTRPLEKEYPVLKHTKQ